MENNIPIIDFHLHVPDQLSLKREFNANKTAQQLLQVLEKNKVKAAVLIAVETNPSLFRKKITIAKMRRAVEELIASGFYILPRQFYKFIEEPEKMLKEHESILKAAHTPSDYVIEVAKYSNARLLPVASMPPLPTPPRDIIKKVEEYIRKGAIGIKIFPTLHLIERKQLNIIDDIAEILENRNAILIIHTGCDPGIWEMPFFCQTANPSFYEKIARRHKDLVIVLAHSGSYSALKPGIFVHEAIKMIKSFNNVYGDTAALTKDIIEYLTLKLEAEKLLFGSDYPVVVGQSLSDSINTIFELNIPRKWVEKLLYRNALDVLNSIGLKISL